MKLNIEPRRGYYLLIAPGNPPFGLSHNIYPLFLLTDAHFFHRNHLISYYHASHPVLPPSLIPSPTPTHLSFPSFLPSPPSFHPLLPSPPSCHPSFLSFFLPFCITVQKPKQGSYPHPPTYLPANLIEEIMPIRQSTVG